MHFFNAIHRAIKLCWDLEKGPSRAELRRVEGLFCSDWKTHDSRLDSTRLASCWTLSQNHLFQQSLISTRLVSLDATFELAFHFISQSERGIFILFCILLLVICRHLISAQTIGLSKCRQTDRQRRRRSLGLGSIFAADADAI